MLRIYEFEVFEDDGCFLAFPFDMDGGTQGETFAEACEMAADWLQTECEHRAMHDEPFPKATFGNAPKNGGTVVVIAVKASKDTVRRLSPSEAARMLGVTPGRVTQMVAANKLEAFELNGRKWITLDSVEARLHEAPKAGRPKKHTTA